MPKYTEEIRCSKCRRDVFKVRTTKPADGKCLMLMTCLCGNVVYKEE